MGLAIGLFGLAVGLTLLGSAQVGFWPALFVALVPLFLLLEKSRPRARRWWIWLYGALMILLHHLWVLDVARLPWLEQASPWIPVFIVVAFLLMAGLLGLVGLLFAWIFDRSENHRLAWFLLPTGWVAMELLVSLFLFGQPLTALGMGFVQAAPFLLWPATIGGVWLVSWFLVAANTLVWQFFRTTPSRTPPGLHPRGVSWAVALGVVGYLVVGWWLMRPLLGPASPAGGPTSLPVRLLRLPPAFTGTAPVTGLPVSRFGRGMTDPELVITPEETYGTRPGQEAGDLAILQTFLDPNQLLLTGVARDDGIGRDNLAYLISREKIIGSVGKVAPVVFGEQLPFPNLWSKDLKRQISVNVRPFPLHDPLNAYGAKLGVLFCSELLESDRVADIIKRGSNAIVTLSNLEDIPHPWLIRQFEVVTKLRSIEYGRPSLYVSNQGSLLAVSANGEVLDLARPTEQRDVTIALPLATRSTPRIKLTDPLLLVVFLSLAVGFGYTRNRIKEG